MRNSRRTRALAIGTGVAALAVLAPNALGQTGDPGGGTPQPSAPVFVPLPEPPQVNPTPDRVLANLRGLIIEQRISSAAIRRIHGVEAWINAGMVTDDFAGGGLTRRELMPGIRTRRGATHDVATPSPRPLDVPQPPAQGQPVQPADSLQAQLRINQRISAVAVARVNALTARMNGGLTGGDIRPGQVGLGQLESRLYINNAPASVVSPAASTTNVQVPPRAAGDPIVASNSQAVINQRIAQAAVRRSNALMNLVQAGIAGASFQEDTIGTDRLGPGLR